MKNTARPLTRSSSPWPRFGLVASEVTREGKISASTSAVKVFTSVTTSWLITRQGTLQTRPPKIWKRLQEPKNHLRMRRCPELNSRLKRPRRKAGRIGARRPNECLRMTLAAATGSILSSTMA